MNKFKTFFYTFKRSLFDIEYYKDILPAKFSFSLKYLIALLFILSALQGIQFFIAASVFTPKIPQFIEQARTAMKQAYPSELEMVISNNELKTNVQEPYYIDIIEVKKEFPQFDHFITIDTKANIEDYHSKASMILLTKKAIAYPKSSNAGLSQYEVAPFEAFEGQPFVINKRIYLEFVKEISPFLDKIPQIVQALMWFVLLVWPFIGTIFNLVGKLSYLLFASLLLWLVSKIFKNNLTYTDIYRLAMHGLTLPIVVGFLLTLFDVRFQYIFTAGFLLWMVIILSKIPVQKPSVPKETLPDQTSHTKEKAV